MSPQHLIMVVLITAVWGANLVAVKVGLVQFPPFVLASLRFGLILVVLLPWLKVINGQMVNILLISVFAGALHFAAMFTGLYLADDVSSAAIASQLNVPMSTIMAVIFLGERIHFWRIFGITLSFSGVMILGFDPHVFQYVNALLIMGFAAFVYSVATILMRKVKNVGVFELQAWLALVSVPFMVAMSFVFEPGTWQHVPEMTWQTLGAILFSAFGASIFGHGGVYFLLQRYTVAVVSPFLLLAPVFGVIFAVLFLGDTLTGQMMTGGLVTLFGVSIITLRQRKQPQPMPVFEEPVPDARD